MYSGMLVRTKRRLRTKSTTVLTSIFYDLYSYMVKSFYMYIITSDQDLEGSFNSKESKVAILILEMKPMMS